MQAYFFYGIFYLRHPFPVFRKNLHFKVTKRQEKLSTLFLNQGWLPLLKMIKINTLQLILVLLLSEKSENMADFLKIFKKLSQSLLLCLAPYLEEKMKLDPHLFCVWKHYGTVFLSAVAGNLQKLVSHNQVLYSWCFEVYVTQNVYFLAFFGLKWPIMGKPISFW